MSKLTPLEIERIYHRAAKKLQKDHPNWLVNVEDNSLVIQLNWQNITYFNGLGLTKASKTYRHIVKVYPDRTFVTIDAFADDENSVGLAGISVSSEAFAGKSFSYKKEAMLGKDEESKEAGLINYDFDTRDIQRPVKEYFKEQGLKYKFYSFRENIKAIPPQLMVIIGAIFIFISVFWCIQLILMFADPSGTVTTTVNGVTTVKVITDLSMAERFVWFAFPVIFVCCGIPVMGYYLPRWKTELESAGTKISMNTKVIIGAITAIAVVFLAFTFMILAGHAQI